MSSAPVDPQPQRTSAGELTLSYVGKPHIAPAPHPSMDHAQPAVMLRGSLVDESEVIPADAPRDLDVWVPGGRGADPKRPVGRGLQLEKVPGAPLPAGMFQAGTPQILAAAPEPTVPETPAAKVPSVAVTYAQVPRQAPAPVYDQSPQQAYDWATRAAAPRPKPRSHALTFVLLFALVAVVLALIYMLRFVDMQALQRSLGIG